MILLRGGTVVDGTGGAPFTADVLVRDGRIAAVERMGTAPDAQVIDCAGLTVAPGFIDAHSHSDLQVLENCPEKARQGVTTEVVGNCGFSPYPAAGGPRAAARFRQRHLVRRGRLGLALGAASTSRQAARRSRHGAGRVAGGARDAADAWRGCGWALAERESAMERALDESLAAGACGFSTGLMYSPGASAPFEELERLCRVVARHGKIYATHMRDYSFRLPEAVEEQTRAGAPHGLPAADLALAGRRPRDVGYAGGRRWKRSSARGRKGWMWPSTATPTSYGSTVLTQLLPQGALEGGAAGLMARLTDPAERARHRARNAWPGCSTRWTDLFIAAVGSAANQDAGRAEHPGPDRAMRAGASPWTPCSTCWWRSAARSTSWSSTRATRTCGRP